NTTGENAVIVSGCVSQQAEALQTARSSMPVPPPTPPLPQPVGFNQPDSVTQTNAFAQPPIASPGPISSTAQSAVAHQQAARVMQQYQSSSADISRTIPQFAAPTNPVSNPAPPPVGNPAPPVGPPNTGPAPVAVGGFGRTVPAGGSPGRGSLPAVESGGGQSGIGTTQGSPTPRGSGSTGAGVTGEGEAAQGSRSTPMASGGGLGGAGGRREEDREHKRKYWQEDDGIFELEKRVAPRVIGEEKRA
ncbi:MAG TPA: hypothetical protein VGM75_30440, partial [Pseudonocardiaceae bacterium]